MIEPEELDAVVCPHLAALDAPGAAVAVVHPEGPPLVRCYGWADIATRRPVDTTTRFRIGSVTKTMTTIVVLQLVERGLLGLDDPVDAHLKGIEVRQREPGAEAVTIRHLLTHTSGIGEFPSWRSTRHPLRALGASRPGTEMPSLRDLVADGVVAEVPPGTKWAYSNVGFTLLGMVAENVTGQPFGELLGDGVFGPLSMSGASVARDADVDATLATGYRVRRGVAAPTRPFDIAALPAGGAHATISDMAAYAGGVLWAAAGDGRLLTRDTARLMMTPQFGIDPRLPKVGLSWWLDGIDSTFTAGHGGTVPGFSTGLVLAPGAGVGVAVLLNRGVLPSAFFGGGHVASAVLRRIVGTEDPAVTPAASDFDGSGRPDSWTDKAGVYRPAPGLGTNMRALHYLGGEIEVLDAGDHLVARAPVGPFRAGLRLYGGTPADPDAYSVSYGGYVLPFVFSRDSSGAVDAVNTGFVPCPFRLVRCPTGTRTYASHVRRGTAVAAGLLAARAVLRGRRR